MTARDEPPPSELKIVFAGSMGAGKTTAIRCISECDVVSTDVPISGGTNEQKKLTTVGLDYGECRLGDGLALRLFGTPGQERFEFMWGIIGPGAFGLIVLADNSRPDPIGDVERCLRGFAAHVPQRRTVVGVGRTEAHSAPGVDAYCERLARMGAQGVPVLEVDVRRREDVLLLLSVLTSMAELEHD